MAEAAKGINPQITPEEVLERAYEGFLELPVPVWLGVMWLGGVTIMGACVLALYYLLSLSVQMVAGA